MRSPAVLARSLAADPRHYQIAVLVALLAWGLLALDLEVRVGHATAIIGAALATQWLATRLVRLPCFDPRSALISALSLTLLLRADAWWLAAAAAVIAIGSKFLIRVCGRHIVNPSNLGLVAMMIVTGGVWVSPGQWGQAAWFALLVAGAGGFVVHRAARGDVALAFLGTWAAILIARALWLGDPLAIPLHRLQSGSLLVFAFFMITDPRTTPASRAGRVVFGAAVAALGAYIELALYEPNGAIWALAPCAVLVPLLDRLLPTRGKVSGTFLPGRSHDTAGLSKKPATRQQLAKRFLTPFSGGSAR